MKQTSIAIIAIVSGILTTAGAEVIDKANNSDALALESSWVGGVVPGSGDVAQWSATVTGAMTHNLGADAGWLGLKLTTAGGAITIAGGNTLTLGASGADLSAAAQNLTLNCAVTLTENQTWNVNTGRVLTLGGGLSAGSVALTKTGAGTLSLSGGAATLKNLYVSSGGFSLTTGTISVSGGGDNASSISGGAFEQTGGTMNSSFYTRLGSASAGALAISGGSFTNKGEILFGFGGSGAGTLTVSDAGTVNAHFLRLGNNAPGTVNLDGGTLTANRIFSNNNAGTFHFNGGTLRAGASSVIHWMEAGIVNPLVKNGGAVIDTAGRNVTITPGLRAASGSTGGLTKLGGGSLTLAGETNTYAGATIVSEGSLIINGHSTGVGSITVKSGGTLGGTGVLDAPVFVENNATLTAGPGLFTTGALTLESGGTLQLALGGANPVVQVNGDLALDGQLLVTDGGGLTAGQTLAAIAYTGTLANHGMKMQPQGEWEVALDTATPGLVKIVVVRKYNFIEFTIADSAVNALTMNLTAIVHGTTTKTMWYEVRDSGGVLRDFGAHVPSSPWNFTVRHLREGVNTVTVFAQPVSGALASNTLRLTLTLGESPAVRPRPVPAEVWWGGLSNNQQLLDPAKPWDFVKTHQDGVFFHSAGYGGLTSTDKQNLAAQLRPFNARYWVELGGGTDTPGDAWVAFQGDTGWGAHLRSQQSLGLVMSQITHDYHMENMEAVCRVHPDWPANDQIAWWTGDLSTASAAYPFTSGLWRDVFDLYYADSPHLKIGHTSSSVYWYWGTYPQLAGAKNNLLYDPLKDANGVPIQVNGGNVSFSFNARDVVLGFVRMAAAGSHPWYSFQTDFPWNYFGAWGNQASATLNREKIRFYERELQANGARHTLICNVSNASAQSGGNDAQDNYYKTKSLNSMTLHQTEGGRANVYLFESWYQGIPHAAAPESKEGSYANLARDAIRHIKGITDNGTPEPLALTLLSSGQTTVVRLQNQGTSTCLPALVAFESGDAALTTQYFDTQNNNITAAMRSAEGWIYTSQLAPGAATTVSIVTSSPPGTVNALRKTASIEVFWNPQDPTGVVRDRLVVSLHEGAFANWQRVNFTPAELADYRIGNAEATPAGDGIANLMKYALGLAPKTPATTGITLKDSGPEWLFTYRRPADRADLTYVVEASPDLGSGAWTSSGITHTRIASGSMETWQASYPSGGGAKMFFRLRVTLP